MILRSFLPERSAEDILAERVRVSIGGQEHILPVLTIAENETWRALAAKRLGGLFGDFASLDNAMVILARLSQATDVMLELLTAYDLRDVLPDADEIRKTTTEPALLKAVLAVTAAAYPLAATALELLVEQPELVVPMLQKQATPSQPSSSPQPRTTGRRAKSVA